MESKSALQTAAQILLDARDAVLEILVGYDVPKITIKTKLDLLINQLGALDGRTLITTNPIEFGPITNFMGEELSRKQPVSMESLTPKELEKKIFNDKIDRIQFNLDKLTDEDILESYQNDKLVLRGLAKRAGLENYKDGEVNLQFLQDIRAALSSQADLATKKVKIEKTLTTSDEEDESIAQ